MHFDLDMTFWGPDDPYMTVRRSNLCVVQGVINNPLCDGLLVMLCVRKARAV